MDITGARFRFWAFCQFVYETFTHPRGEDAADLARARRTLFRRSVLGGHLDDRCFVSMEPDFPELGRGRTLDDEHAILTVAKRHLERYAAMGRAKIGVLAGYANAQIAHLAECRACKDFVCAAVRRDVNDGRHIRSMLGDLSPEAKRRLVEDLVPEDVRRRAKNRQLN